MKELHTANAGRKPVTQADLRALKAKIEGLTANRSAGPPPTQAEINHAIKRQLAPLLVDLEEQGYDVSEVQANLQRMTTNASGKDDGYMRLAPEMYDLPDFESRTDQPFSDLPGDE